MSYWTNLYRTVADNELHFFTISNLNYTVFVSLAHIFVFVKFLHQGLVGWNEYLQVSRYRLHIVTTTV